MENISSSFYLPPNIKVSSLSVEVLKEENEIVRNVQYQKVVDVESIVDNVSRKTIFTLTGNPNVRELSTLNRDYGKSYILYTKAPGVEMGTVYRIDEKNGYVFKVSHLVLEYISLEDNKIGTVCLLGASPKSYALILKWLQTEKRTETDGLVVKVGKDWIPFSMINNFIEED